MVPDRIEREVLIDAPPGVVWAVLTEPDHVAAWFSDSAEIDLRSGGEATFTWDEHGSARAWVERVEPPHLFSFRWARPVAGEPRRSNSTLVEFSLSAESAGTRLRMVETGFHELALSEEEKSRYAGENEQGWDFELGELQAYVTNRWGASARR